MQDQLLIESDFEFEEYCYESGEEESAYEHSYSGAPAAHEELDQFNQRARRSGSLEMGCMSIEQLQEAFGPKETKIESTLTPSFQPAHGCVNASDYLVRCFSARLRGGVTLLKHSPWRWVKSQIGDLTLLPDGRSLAWRQAECTWEKQLQKVDLSTCIEIRHALSPDPSSKKRRNGTPTLRKHCTGAMAPTSFSLIFPKRTLDFTVPSEDLFIILMEGFSALCFRLQLENNHANTEESSSNGGGCSKNNNSDDRWTRSTVNGTDSTECNSTTAGLPSPWGL